MEGLETEPNDFDKSIQNYNPSTIIKTKELQLSNDLQESEILDSSQLERYLSSLNLKTIGNKDCLQLAIKILKYHSVETEMSALEIEALLVATKNMKFFQAMNKNEINRQLSLHQRCCKVMEYVELPKGSVVFEKGAEADKLYIILTGSVNVFAAKTKEQIQKEIRLFKRISKEIEGSQDNDEDNRRRRGVFIHNRLNNQTIKFEDIDINSEQQAYNVKSARNNLFTTTEGSESSSFEKSESDAEIKPAAAEEEGYQIDQKEDESNETKSEIEENPGLFLEKLVGNINPMYIKDISRFITKGVFHLFYETTLGAGFIFGELGLTTNKMRQRTIICKEDCQFATISKRNYLEILNLVKERRRRDKVNFVELNMFPDVKREANERVAEKMSKIKAIKGQKIYQQKDKADKVYLIREGEITVINLIFRYIYNAPQMYVRKGASEKTKQDLWEKYNEVSNYLNKPLAESLRLVPVATLTAGQYFGEEDLLENRPRMLTAICTTLKAKLYTISRNDLRSCFDDFPLLRIVLQDKLKMRMHRRKAQKESYNEIVSLARENDIKAISQTEEVVSIRQSVQEIFSEDNIKAVKLGLKAKIEANTSVLTIPKEKPVNESQTLNLTAVQKPELSPSNRILDPLISSRTHLTRASSVEQLIEYRNHPQKNVAPMDFQRFGKETDRRKLLLRGIRSDVAMKKPKQSTDDLAKMNRIIQSNDKIEKELSKNALPLEDIFPLLKEFTTREDEKKQKRMARVKEIIKIKGEAPSFKLPKLDAADLINIHLNSKRLKRSESVLNTQRDRLTDTSRLISITSCIDRGSQETISSPKKLSANVSMIDEAVDSKKDSMISGIRPLLRGNSVADSGYSHVDSDRDIRYYSVMEVPKNKKDHPTKVSFMLNSRLLGPQQYENQGTSAFITSQDDLKSKSQRLAIIDQYEAQKRKNNSRFVQMYKERSFLNSVDFYGEEGRKVLLKNSSAPRYL